MARQKKTEMVMVRITPDDKAAIQKAAEKLEMSVSEYMRAATLAYLATGFNKHALNAVARGAIELLKEFGEENRQAMFSKKVKI